MTLVGANGAGKTNILEAVSLLNGGMGFRRATSGDIARFGTDGYAVAARLSDGTEMGVFSEGGARRRAKINGEAVPLSELSKHIVIVWLTPSEDQLFMDSPSKRRAFLDNLAAGFDDRHTGRAARLASLLSERAYALKHGHDSTWLDQIENNIVTAGIAVADARVRYAAALNGVFDAGEMGISGMLESRIIGGEKAGGIEDFYRNYMAENRFLTADKMTIDGPHRSDFSIYNKALDLSADKTSSGQQKLRLNRLVIANARLLFMKKPDLPLIVLLDEADSRLDKNARAELFAELSNANAQVWMSGTDAEVFARVPNSEQITVQN